LISGIVDFHTHAFPDELAERAIPHLEAEGNIKAALDGKISSLLRSMDDAGIEISVVASIATKPDQFDNILRWSKEIASDRLVPFPSVHPADPDPPAKARIVHEAGLRGIKQHPYYQAFELDDERQFPFYAEVQERGLILLMHTGFDLAFPRDRIADPSRIARVLAAFPDLKLVTTHLGAWKDWDGVRAHFLGRPVWMGTSFSIEYMEREEARRFVLSHPREYLLFGTDSPWAAQKEALGILRSLDLGEEWERAILRDNALRLLGR